MYFCGFPLIAPSAVLVYVERLVSCPHPHAHFWSGHFAFAFFNRRDDQLPLVGFLVGFGVLLMRPNLLNSARIPSALSAYQASL
jgi:hypothetical protein